MPSSLRLGVALAALIALTVASFALAHVETGAFAAPLAYAIAATKAAIVLVVFMEIGGVGAIGWTSAAIALGFIALLCAGAVADVALR
jgi:caa(3)-type oxidase subunit IV